MLPPKAHVFSWRMVILSLISVDDYIRTNSSQGFSTPSGNALYFLNEQPSLHRTHWEEASHSKVNSL